MIINGINIFTEYDIAIESKQGFLDMPKRKPHITHSWDDEDGIEIEDTKYYFTSRELTINGVLKSDTATDFINKLEAFETELASKNKHHLQFNDLSKVYLVYFDEGIKMNSYRKGIGRFQLKFTELYPRNRQNVLTILSTTIHVTAITGPVTINWGDQSAETVITATGNYTHTFPSLGTWIIFIYGDVDNLTYAI
jgi:hypothetical protein